MYASTMLALVAAVASAAPTSKGNANLDLSLGAQMGSNVFVCPGEASIGGCALGGNPFAIDICRWKICVEGYQS